VYDELIEAFAHSNGRLSSAFGAQLALRDELLAKQVAHLDELKKPPLGLFMSGEHIVAHAANASLRTVCRSCGCGRVRPLPATARGVP
jgi:hypothetical protein